MSLMRGVSVIRWRRSRRGVASLVVTVILCLTVIGIIASLTAISLSENQQASDQDQSTRAINAAQAGVEAMVHKLNEDPNFEQPDCTRNPEQPLGIQSTTGSKTQDIAITCATVANSGTAANGVLQRDQSVMFDLSKSTENDAKGDIVGPDFFNFEWNLNSTDASQQNLRKLFSNEPQFPILPTISDRARPAAIELTFTWCKKQQRFSPTCNIDANFLNQNNGMPTFTTVVDPYPNNPNENKDGINSYCGLKFSGYFSAFDCHIGAYNGKNPAAVCLSALVCTGPNNLSNNFGNVDLRDYNLKVRLTARYAGMHYSIAFGHFAYSNGLALPNYFKFPYSIISVTARKS